MDSAGSHAYVSKNFMDAYLKKKQKIQEKQLKKQERKRSTSNEKMQMAMDKMMAEGDLPQIDDSKIQQVPQFKAISLNRRRSLSKSNSSSGEEEGGIQRCRSVESLFEGELVGKMNYSDEE